MTAEKDLGPSAWKPFLSLPTPECLGRVQRNYKMTLREKVQEEVDKEFEERYPWFRELKNRDLEDFAKELEVVKDYFEAFDPTDECSTATRYWQEIEQWEWTETVFMPTLPGVKSGAWYCPTRTHTARCLTWKKKMTWTIGVMRYEGMTEVWILPVDLAKCRDTQQVEEQVYKEIASWYNKGLWKEQKPLRMAEDCSVEAALRCIESLPIWLLQDG